MQTPTFVSRLGRWALWAAAAFVLLGLALTYAPGLVLGLLALALAVAILRALKRGMGDYGE